MGSPAVVGPHLSLFGGNLHVDGFGLATIGAEVAAPVLQLLQVTDGVGPAGRGHRAHTEWQWHLLGKIIQQGVKAFEAAFVHGHFDSAELTVSALVKGDAFGWGGAHVGQAPLGGCERRVMLFGRGVRVPHPDLD